MSASNNTTDCRDEYSTGEYVPAVVFCVLLTLVAIVQLGIIVVLAARLKGTKLEVELRHYTMAIWNWTVTHVRDLVNRVRGGELQDDQLNNDYEPTETQLQSSEQLGGHPNTIITSPPPQSSRENMAKVMTGTQTKSISTIPSSYPQHQTQSTPMVPKRQDAVSKPPIELTQQLNQKFAERANNSKPTVQDHLPIKKPLEFYNGAGDTSQIETPQNYEVPVGSTNKDCREQIPEVVIGTYDFATVPDIPATKPKKPKASQSSGHSQPMEHYEVPNVIGLQYPDDDAFYEIPHPT